MSSDEKKLADLLALGRIGLSARIVIEVRFGPGAVERADAAERKAREEMEKLVLEATRAGAALTVAQRRADEATKRWEAARRDLELVCGGES